MKIRLHTQVALLLVAAMCLAGCDDGVSIPGFTSPNQTAPILESFGVTFEPYDGATGRAGDFLFDTTHDLVFREFGANVQTPDGDIPQPSFEFRVANDVTIVAPRGGEVRDVIYDANTDDYAIHLIPIKDSAWTVSMHHIRNPLVFPGENVSGGDPLGDPGTFDSLIGRTELEIKRNGVSYCPFDLLRENTDLELRVNTLMSDWEAFKGDDTIYDETAQARPGCLGKIVTIEP